VIARPVPLMLLPEGFIGDTKVQHALILARFH
jgi:hypothetical protein